MIYVMMPWPRYITIFINLMFVHVFTKYEQEEVGLYYTRTRTAESAFWENIIPEKMGNVEQEQY